jgi:hypothetical protein
MFALPAYDPPAIIEPAPPLTEVRKRRRVGDTNWDTPAPARPRARISVPAWLFIGAIVLDKNGRRCTVVHIDDVNGLFYCAEDQQ